ncbi:MAG: hypothetical protein H7X94_09375 [Vallitaleaceae bacterium]|nr:hypothetical protein [Vallitaleaceae bacterium]
MMVENNFSLLWPDSIRKSFTIGEVALLDLNLTAVMRSVLSASSHEIPAFMKTLACDGRTIRYRQALLQEFVSKELLFEQINHAIMSCYELQNKGKFAFEKEATLYNLVMRIGEAGEVMRLIELLLANLKAAQVTSEGLLKLTDLLKEVVLHPLYESFKTDVETVKNMDEGVKSIKVGVNLDENLKPMTAMLLSLHDQPFSYTRLLKKTAKVVSHGMTELLSIPRKMFFPDTIQVPQALNSFEKILEPAMKQLIIFCDKFIDGLVTLLAGLKVEMPFYEIGIKIHKDLVHEGFSLCLPEINESFECSIQGAYNLNLAYELIKKKADHGSLTMVPNDFIMESGGNIMILTGANRGGKTTFTQAIGQIFWLGHLGYYVPAQKASLCLIDGLFLHFPSEESQTDQKGRLGDECKRFSEIYEQMTKKSLLLMNESFSGTSHLESLTIAVEVVKAVKAIGAKALFNTHLHELGSMVEAINSAMVGSPKLLSLVAGDERVHQTFKIQEGPPLGQSYARDIANQYGMTFEQLIGEAEKPLQQSIE